MYLATNKLEAEIMTDETAPDVMNRKQAAAFLGICRTTLDSLDIPRTQIRRKVFYKREAICKWLDTHSKKGKGKK
jgi:hypothetical protein